MEKQRKKDILQKLLLKSLASQEVELFKEVYSIFDTENKGYVDLGDFRRLMSRCGTRPSEEELQEIFKDHDLDGDGKVTFDDLAYVAIKNRDQRDYRREILKAFHEYDMDLNGLLDIYELQHILKSIIGLENIKTTEVKEILSEFDINKDGVISAAEFLRLLTQ